MSAFVFLLAILGAITVAVVFSNSEKYNDDYVGKFWGYVFAFLIAWIITFLTEKAIEYENSFPNKNNIEIYNSYY